MFTKLKKNTNKEKNQFGMLGIDAAVAEKCLLFKLKYLRTTDIIGFFLDRILIYFSRYKFYELQLSTII